MLELYYFHDSTCGIKARMTLFEKGIEFVPRVLGRFELAKPEYLTINPKGVVPTLVHDNKVITESNVICVYIDEQFDGPALQPTEASELARMTDWLNAIDEKYFKGLGSTTFGLAIRKQILARHASDEALEEYFRSIRVDEYRVRRRSLVTHGIDAPEVHDGLRVLAEMINNLDDALALSAYAAGPDYSLADACLTPFIMRLEVLGLNPMWDDKPAIAEWWTRIQSRESYKRLISESFPPEYFDSMYELVGDIWPEVQAIVENPS